MIRRRQNRRGNSLIEFTLVGIPLIFVLISIFEIARGMWIYHTLAYAVTEGTRYATVHGANCSANGNTCWKTVGDVSAQIQYVGVGLLPDQLMLTFKDAAGALPACRLQACLANTTVWPRSGGSANLPGMDITISATYPFTSAIAMFWPGAGQGVVFPTFTLPASSTERIQF